MPASSPAVAVDTFYAELIVRLFGLTTHQTYRYFRLYPSDRLSLKILVSVLLCLDTLHTITGVHVSYHYLISNYANPASLLTGIWSVRVGMVETVGLERTFSLVPGELIRTVLRKGVVMVIAHSFYIYRLFFISDRHIFPAYIMAVLTATELAFAIAATIQAFKEVTFARFRPWIWIICAALGCSLLVNGIVSSFLIVYLRRSRSNLRRSITLVTAPPVVSYQSFSEQKGLFVRDHHGLHDQYGFINQLSSRQVASARHFSTLTRALDPIQAIIVPDTLVWAAIAILSTKMYANSLLAVLNSRRSLVDKGREGFETGSFGLQVLEPRRASTSRSRALAAPSSPERIQLQRLRPPHRPSRQTLGDAFPDTNTMLNAKILPDGL
ncbi:hypothetical protein C8T65DRAFT_825365 [Cerioporus squamosus]|nr:hypothetical protein C8T65DRAFT_825365 [Cerioporus squamosus]